MAGELESLADGIAAVVPQTAMYEAPAWADPHAWLLAAVIIIIVTLIGIYFKFRDWGT